MTWNPLQQLDTQTFPLECSGGVASATFRPWAARERIAYEDALTSRIVELGLGDDDRDVEAIKLGSMRLVQLALTIVSVEGFPDECIVENADGSTETVKFDPRDERCLAALDEETYNELREHAKAVQSPPGEPAEGEDTADAGAHGAQEAAPDADPSPTPSTPPAATPAATRQRRASSDAG